MTIQSHSSCMSLDLSYRGLYPQLTIPDPGSNGIRRATRIEASQESWLSTPLDPGSAVYGLLVATYPVRRREIQVSHRLTITDPF